MTMLARVAVILFLGAGSAAWAQPLTLNDVAEYLEDTALGVDAPQKILEAVRRNGVDFILDDASLARLIEAARKGKRTDAFTASLIFQLLRTCTGCAERYFGPLELGDVLLNLDKQIPREIVMQEVRVRGTKGIPKTEESVKRMREKRAWPELIDLILPADEIYVPEPPGYTRAASFRSTDYNRRSPVGRLDIQVDVAGEAELLFTNNALFVRPLDDGARKLAPSSVAAKSVSFSSPAPVSLSKPELVFVSRVEEKRKLTILLDSTKSIIGGKGAKLPDCQFADDLPSGRKGFRIMISEPDRKQAHSYEIRLKWNNPGVN